MDTEEQFISFAEVKRMVGLEKSALYERISKGKFPRPIKDGRNRWLLREVRAYTAAKIRERDEKDQQPRKGTMQT